MVMVRLSYSCSLGTSRFNSSNQIVLPNQPRLHNISQRIQAFMRMGFGWFWLFWGGFGAKLTQNARFLASPATATRRFLWKVV
jgi:hypothetical protein